MGIWLSDDHNLKLTFCRAANGVVERIRRLRHCPGILCVQCCSDGTALVAENSHFASCPKQKPHNRNHFEAQLLAAFIQGCFFLTCSLVGAPSEPVLIAAGPGSGKTTVMALRALYIIGMLRQLSRSSQGFDDVVALTFSRRYSHCFCRPSTQLCNTHVVLATQEGGASAAFWCNQ